MPAMNTTGNSRPFALCMVSSETGAASSTIVGVGDQRGVIQEVGARLAALRRVGCGVEQFVQVREARAASGFGSASSILR